MTAQIRSPRFFAFLAVVIVVLAVAGCGSSSSKVSAGSYVGSVCSATADWYRTVQVAGRKLQSTVHTSKSLSDVKHAYVAFVDALLQATQRAQQQLKHAGTPSVNGGKQISNEIKTAFDRAQRGLRSAAAAVRKAPTSNSTAFEAAAGGIQSTVQRSLQSMSALAPQKSSQLHAAALKDPSCQRLRALG